VDDGGGAATSKSKSVNKVRVSGKPKLIYRPVSNPSNNNQATTSIPRDPSPIFSKEGVKLACDKPIDAEQPHAIPMVPNDGSNSSNTDGKYFKDEINLAELKSFIDERMEAEKVIDIPKDVVPKDVNDGSVMADTSYVSSINDISLHEPPGSLLMDKGKEAGPSSSSLSLVNSGTKRSNPFSKVGEVIDSDSEVDEVLNSYDESVNLFDMPMGTLSSTGGAQDQEDYYEYDDYTDQLHEIPRHLVAYYEDFKLQGRTR
jgi:hypothetical protein